MEMRIMGRRSFLPVVGESRLESRISLSRAGAHAVGIPVVVYGSETNPGLFDGLVEKKVHGHWYNAVFFNGQRRSEWAPHPGGPTAPGSIYLLKGDALVPSPKGHWAPR